MTTRGEVACWPGSLVGEKTHSQGVLRPEPCWDGDVQRVVGQLERIRLGLSVRKLVTEEVVSKTEGKGPVLGTRRDRVKSIR